MSTYVARISGEGGSGDEALAQRYRILRRLLAANSEMLDLLADLESDLWHVEPAHPLVRRPVLRLLDGSLLLAENLNLLTGNRFRALYEGHRRIAAEVRGYLSSLPVPASLPLVVPLAAASRARLGEIGGKAANLAELAAAMPDAVPPGFALTTAAYRAFLDDSGIFARIRALLENMSLIMERQLFRQRAATIRELVERAEVPARVREAIAAGVAGLPGPAPSTWAVRSSAVGEDGVLSFAGQFESILHVPTDGLAVAYARVVASRWADRALAYRLIGSFSEAETPMAVLFLPMLEARVAGVLYTRDPGDPGAERMLVNATAGLADEMVRGGKAGHTLAIARAEPHRVEEVGEPDSASAEPPLSPDEATRLARLALAVESHFGAPQDIEWVITGEGRVMVVQSRPLALEPAETGSAPPPPAVSPLLHGGITVCAGRAMGTARRARSTDDLASVPPRSVLIVRQATPELAAVLPSLAGVVAEQGNVAGHAATLIREFRIPAVFGMRLGEITIEDGAMVSLDAGARALYAGAVWPALPERARRHVRAGRERRERGTLEARILTLNLVDPLASSFQAGRCTSVHDIVRFAHEKAVAAMFSLGDEVSGRGTQRVWKLLSPVPLSLVVLDLGGAVPAVESRRGVAPEEILCAPFAALWRGMTTEGVSWAGRVNVSVAGFSSVVASSITDAWASLRGLGEHNYALVAPDYLNLNARLGYHFTMIDGLVTDAPENNFVNFRFRGGAASTERRDLRARFLAEVLRGSSFSVDQRGDLVTAWMRRYPRAACEDGLTLLGRLLGCARQLDMLMSNDAAVEHFAERFRAGDYQAFA